MGSWRKRLAAMIADSDPRSYTFEEAAGILDHIGFVQGSHGGSHRRFRRELPDPNVPSGKRGVIIGLVQSGSGCLKPVYVVEMIAALRENKLLPKEVLEL